jgi:uncharacterized protein (DUF1778 family)
MKTKNLEAQTERIQLRASTGEKRLLQEAAAASHKTLSEFILGTSVVEAEIALASRTRFVLGSKQWAKFMDMLEQPVTDKPRMRKLLTEPSVLER